MTTIIARDPDGSEEDITEQVRTAYDCVVSSMDWGSGFLDTEERHAICELAVAIGTSDVDDRRAELEADRRLTRLETEYKQRRAAYAASPEAAETTHVRYISECENCPDDPDTRNYDDSHEARRSRYVYGLWSGDHLSAGHHVIWSEEYRTITEHPEDFDQEPWWILDCETCGPAGRIAYQNKEACNQAVDGHLKVLGHNNVGMYHEGPESLRRDGWVMTP